MAGGLLSLERLREPMEYSAKTLETPEDFELLQPLGFLSGLEPAILRDVLRNCTQVMLPAGHLLFSQGDVADSIYLVATGMLDVSIQLEGQEPSSIYEAGRGQLVGEMGLLTGDPRSATVRSLRDCLLFRLSRERFEELLERYPVLTRRIACELSERLKQANSRQVIRSSGSKTFAVVPAGEVAQTAQFVTELTAAFSEVGPTRRISKRTVEEAVGSADMSDSRVVHWLNEQESRFTFLIYEADLQATEWTSRCIRQADRILTVARFEGNKGLNEIERDLAVPAVSSGTAVGRRKDPRIELVLLHKEPTFRPSGTPEWLEHRSANKHHHLCADCRMDYGRLAKVLTGKAVNVVLGGGGARGFAHIGALRAIEESGYTIESVGGTSQGALIGAQYAMGLSPAEMIETNRALFRDFRPFKGDMTLPIFSFVTGVTSNRGLQGLFGKTFIADLKIPFFSAATNLSRAKLVVNRDQPVWKAVRCSMALPGLMPPVIQGGNLIIDGGVLNNLPVDIMRKSCNGEVIAVDVSPPNDLMVDCEDRESLTFMQYMRRKIAGKKKSGSLPHLIEILMRTAFLSSIHHREAMSKNADLLIHPPMAGFGLLDWDSLETLVEIGYRATRDQLKHWKAITSLRTMVCQTEGCRPGGCATATCANRA